VVAFPVGDQRVVVRLQRGVERGGGRPGEFDPPAGQRAVGGFGDRGLRCPTVGIWAGFEFDRGTQLVDRGVARQLGVMGIGALPGAGGDDADLIE